MRYYVLAPSGERYGPADIATLNEWAAANRLFPNSRLVEEMSGAIVNATTVVGLRFPQAAPVAPSSGSMIPPPPGGVYQPAAPITPGGARYSAPATHDTGAKEMWSAFGAAILAPIVGLLLIYGIIIAVGGVRLAWSAYQKGQKLAILALILNIIAIPVAFYMRFVLRYQFLYGR